MKATRHDVPSNNIMNEKKPYHNNFYCEFFHEYIHVQNGLLLTKRHNSKE